MKLLKGQKVELRSGEHVTYIRRCYSEGIAFVRVVYGNGKIRVISEREVVDNLGPFPEDTTSKLPAASTDEMFTQKQMEGKQC